MLLVGFAPRPLAAADQAQALEVLRSGVAPVMHAQAGVSERLAGLLNAVAKRKRRHCHAQMNN